MPVIPVMPIPPKAGSTPCRILSTAEAAERLGVKPCTLRYHVMRGRLTALPPERVNSPARYCAQEVEMLAVEMARFPRAGVTVVEGEILPDDADLLDLGDACRLLGVSEAAFRHYIRQGFVARAAASPPSPHRAYYQRADVEALRSKTRRGYRESVRARFTCRQDCQTPDCQTLEAAS